MTRPHPPHRLPSLLSTWLALAVCCAAPVHAQEPEAPAGPAVAGTVSEADGRPVLGALVALEAEDGRRLRSTLTDREGRFHLGAPGPGAYRLRVERLGYAPTTTGTLRIASGQVLHRDVEVTGAPIRLREVDVRVEADLRRCVVDPEEGSLLADLWEQARQAFRRVEVTEEEAAYQLHLRRYERSVEIPTARVLDERWSAVGSSLESFRSPPALDLLGEGWIRRGTGGEMEYFGPDLHVLLSREFQDAFCFRLRTEAARPGELGLAFEPARTERIPSIRGTLWMDGETVELTALAFHYTRHLLRPELPPALLEVFGGEVAFRSLPDGRWVVDRWVLRIPEFRRMGRRAEWRIPDDPALRERQEDLRRRVERTPRNWQQAIREGRLLFREEGGDLEWIRTRAGTLVPPRGEAAVAGTVWDSLQVPPRALAGARVGVEGTEVETLTDAQGRYRLVVPLEGSYRLSFHHPTLDTLALRSPEPAAVSLRPGLVEEVDLAIPSRATLLAAPCANEPAVEGTGILVGRVLDQVVRAPVPEATVRIRPVEGRRWLRTLATRTGTDGTFRFCRVPSGTEYELVAELLGDEGPAQRVVLAAPGRILELDALVDPGQIGRIAGRVREGEGGPWVEAATVHLEGPERRTAVTDQRGRFELDELLPGSYRVRVEHIAFRDMETALEVPVGPAIVHAELRLLRDAIALAPIHVEVERRNPHLVRVGYYDRMLGGAGSFVGRDDIERRHVIRTSQVLRGLPRVRTVSTQGGGEVVYFRGHESFRNLDGVCPPQIFVDGMRELDGLVDHIHPEEIEAIELYPGAASVPAQFGGANARCGVILIWTRF